jgi:nicotinamidase/pyrazinamidase
VNQFDSRTALIVVDYQNDFADPSGSLYVSGGERLLGAINAEIASAISSDALIVYTQDWHPPSTPHFAKDGGIWPVHCVAGSWGAELLPGLEVGVAERIRKGVAGEDGYSAFSMRDPESGASSGTGLAERLRSGGIEQVVVCGLATDYCVKETALDAARLGFAVVLRRDLIAAVDLRPGDGERALSEMAAAGVELA